MAMRGSVPDLSVILGLRGRLVARSLGDPAARRAQVPDLQVRAAARAGPGRRAGDGPRGRAGAVGVAGGGARAGAAGADPLRDADPPRAARARAAVVGGP